jgi:SAM-dependent methyltransferase
LDRIEREKLFHDQEFEQLERRQLDRFYRIALPSIERFIASCVEAARGKRVLEIGCGPGSVSLRLAAVAASVTGIDISDTAVRQARERASKAGLAHVEFRVMNAEELDLPPQSFDFVCGRAILHHLDLSRALPALARVLAPSGYAIFLEPLGHNPVVNWYRNRTPHLRTPDEHPLLRSDLRFARTCFASVEVHPEILASLAAAPLPAGALFQTAHAVLSAADRVLLALPGLRWWGWTSVWRFSDPLQQQAPSALHP